MKVFKFLWLILSIKSLETVDIALNGHTRYNNCINVYLNFKNAFVQPGGFVALQYEVRTKDKKLEEFSDISYIEQRSEENSSFYLLQFKFRVLTESLKMLTLKIKNDSFQCNNKSFDLGMNLTSSTANFRSAVKHTNFCEKYELRKFVATLKIFAFGSQKKHVSLPANRSFDVEETALGLLSIEVSTGIDDDVLKTAEKYRKKNCPLENTSVGVIGYLVVAFFVITISGYSCYHVFRKHSLRFPVEVHPYVPKL